MRAIFLAPAEEEMLEAARYDESQAQGLGWAFLAEVRRTVDHRAENPQAGTVVRGEIRRRLVRRFPFGVLYRLDPHEIIVMAVMHLRRRPGYWADRV